MRSGSFVWPLVVGVGFLTACGGGESPGSPAGGGAGGTTSPGGGGTGGTGAGPGADAVVTPFDQTHVYFTGDDNKRIVDSPASFPATGTYGKIVLHLSLDCPNGGCDAWDRFGSLSIVTKKGENGAPDEEIEIARFITPYKVASAWDIDVTDLRPLLSGDILLRSFIDTWVGPGSPYGAGWLVTASFEMTGGVPEKEPVGAIPIWRRTYVVYGDPAKSIASQVPVGEAQYFEASSYAVRAFVTGHGQGNADNCAEFCPRDHTITVGQTAHTQSIWRDDCATTATPGQQGTWKYPRAGWCPGADVLPWVMDVTADLGADSSTITYDVEAYENTCRPDANPCAGCTLGTGCAYDGGAHTEPNYQLSALLIAYR